MWITTLHDTMFVDLSINASYGIHGSGSPSDGLLLDVQEPDKLNVIEIAPGDCLYVPTSFPDPISVLRNIHSVVFVVDTATVLRVPIRKR